VYVHGWSFGAVLVGCDDVHFHGKQYNHKCKMKWWRNFGGHRTKGISILLYIIPEKTVPGKFP
jgi:hypothetical protein